MDPSGFFDAERVARRAKDLQDEIDPAAHGNVCRKWIEGR